jgi:1-acyl-sn-glycerol-3-phosphate acyltransferase
VNISDIGTRKLQREKYDPKRWELSRRLCRFLLRTIGFSVLVRIDKVEGMENLPRTGPAVLIFNHIAFVDPVMLVHVMPRDIVPLAKKEVFRIPGVGIFPKLWGVIPVSREGFDRQAIQAALGVLEAGEILLVAPEGTRNSQLQQAKEGVSYLAGRSGAPVVPIAIEGTTGFPSLPFLKRWRQPGVRVKVGKPFRYKAEFRRANREQLRIMADEAMYILAAMLPQERRGVYAKLQDATQETIEWL